MPREAAAPHPIEEAESLSRSVHSDPEELTEKTPKGPTDQLRTETPMHIKVMHVKNILLPNLEDPNQKVSAPEVSKQSPTLQEQLVTLGVRALASEVQAGQYLPAGRITHFLKNWDL